MRRATPLTSALLLSIQLGACAAAAEPGAGNGADEGPLPAVAEPLPPFRGTVYAAAAATALPPVEPEDHASLHNVFQLSEAIVSGSEPHGEEAFRILRSKGIRTILSVDGKVPDAALAAKHGMKYVHVPIQYRGIGEEELARIAKTFREQEGPFYVHCFHGKHRGPAAAAIGRVVLDGASRETALAEMRQYCGTAPSYEGLYAAIAHARIPPAHETRAIAWDFPAASPLEGIAEAMIVASRADDHLKALSRNGWRPDPAHPDLDALNEAVELAEVFQRSATLEEVAAKPEDFRQWIHDSAEQAAALREAVRGLSGGASTAADADRAYAALSATCSACHDAYRNH